MSAFEDEQRQPPQPYSSDSIESLSRFGKRLFEAPPMSYVVKRAKYFHQQYHAETCPQGKILLCTAENKLLSPLLAAKLQQIFREEAIPPQIMGYTDPLGVPSFRTQIASFFSKYLLSDQRIKIDPRHLCVGSGCVAMLTSLSLLLFEENDVVLIPSPYYPAFDHDFFNFAHAVVQPIFCPQEEGNFFGRLSEEAIEKSFHLHNSPSNANRVKAILLSNPHNPLGTIYSIEELESVLKVLQRHPSLHLIMDEIYALSTFSPLPSPHSNPHRHPNPNPPLSPTINNPTANPNPSSNPNPKVFVSILEVLEKMIFAHEEEREELRKRVHLVWSFSKDFGGSGLRIGVLLSQNQAILSAMDAGCNEPMMASTLTQYSLEKLLRDEVFLDQYLRRNSEELLLSYSLLSKGLREVGVEVIAAQGAIFLFADFRQYCSSFAEEEALFSFLVEGRTEREEGREAEEGGSEGSDRTEKGEGGDEGIGGVILTPGESCRCRYPGFFRICYAFVSREVLSIAIERIKRSLPLWQKQRKAGSPSIREEND